MLGRDLLDFGGPNTRPCPRKRWTVPRTLKDPAIKINIVPRKGQ
jgi:hypothetical protein